MHGILCHSLSFGAVEQVLCTCFCVDICMCLILFLSYNDSYCLLFCRGEHDAHAKWYKFDDGDVMECKMDDDEVSSKGFSL